MIQYIYKIKNHVSVCKWKKINILKSYDHMIMLLIKKKNTDHFQYTSVQVVY